MDRVTQELLRSADKRAWDVLRKSAMALCRADSSKAIVVVTLVYQDLQTGKIASAPFLADFLAVCFATSSALVKDDATKALLHSLAVFVPEDPPQVLEVTWDLITTCAAAARGWTSSSFWQDMSGMIVGSFRAFGSELISTVQVVPSELKACIRLWATLPTTCPFEGPHLVEKLVDIGRSLPSDAVSWAAFQQLVQAAWADHAGIPIPQDFMTENLLTSAKWMANLPPPSSCLHVLWVCARKEAVRDVLVTIQNATAAVPDLGVTALCACILCWPVSSASFPIIMDLLNVFLSTHRYRAVHAAACACLPAVLDNLSQRPTPEGWRLVRYIVAGWPAVSGEAEQNFKHPNWADMQRSISAAMTVLIKATDPLPLRHTLMEAQQALVCVRIWMPSALTSSGRTACDRIDAAVALLQRTTGVSEGKEESSDTSLATTPVAGLAALRQCIWGLGNSTTYRDHVLGHAMPVGLMNLGNTCYLNATMQALFATAEFRRAILTHDIPADLSTWTPLLNVQTLFANMALSCVPCFSPAMLHKQLPAPFNEFGQQDASEFARTLLSQLCSAGKDGQELGKTIENIFEGQLTSAVTCQTCANQSCKSESFAELTLAVPATPPDGKPCSVPQLLASHFAVEMLTQENAVYCSRCEKQCDAAKKLSVAKAPATLVVSLSRFRYDVESKSQVKIMTPVECPDELVIPEVSGTAASTAHTYDIFAIVVHRGLSAEHGHYIACCKHMTPQGNPAWFCFDDSTVSVSHKPDPSDTPYLLWYRRRDVPDVLEGPREVIPKLAVIASWCNAYHLASCDASNRPSAAPAVTAPTGPEHDVDMDAPGSNSFPDYPDPGSHNPDVF